MKYYDSFSADKKASQLLFTYEDLKHENHINDLIQSNLRAGIWTVGNYNDAIDFFEARYDNEWLAANLVKAIDADRLIIVGNGYDGFLDDSGNTISRIHAVDDSLYDMCRDVSSHGTGGFKTKLDAAKYLLNLAKETLVMGSNYSIGDCIRGKHGTLFKK